jgi:hypothetical protein
MATEAAKLLERVPSLDRLPSVAVAAGDATGRQPWRICMGGPLNGAASSEQRWACGSASAGLLTAAACVSYAAVGPLLIVSNK